MTCCCNYIFVYDILRSIFTFQRKFLLFSTVTMFRLLLLSIGQLFVAWLDNGTHTGRRGIAYFYSISIESFVQPVNRKIYMVIKTEQFCISFEICFVILNLFYWHMSIFVMLRTIGACSFLQVASLWCTIESFDFLP